MNRQKNLTLPLLLITLVCFLFTLKNAYPFFGSDLGFLWISLLPALSGLLFFLLGGFAFFYLPQPPGSWPLLGFQFLVGNFFILLPVIQIFQDSFFLLIVLLAFIPSTMIHFTLRYSEILLDRERPWLFYSSPYGLSLLILGLAFYFLMKSPLPLIPIPQILISYLLLASLFWFLGLAVSLRRPHPELHRIVTWALLLGQFLGIFIPLTLGIGFALKKSSFSLHWISPMILLFPLSLLIGIFPRKRDLSQAYVVLSQKRQTSGNLLEGLAHEINNPMTFIYSSLEPLRESILDLKKALLEQPEKASAISLEIDQLIDNMEEGAKRAKSLIEKIRVFPQEREERKEVDLNQIITQSIALLAHKWGGRIRIVEQYAILPKIQGSPGELGQVFTNLIANACDSIENRGEIQVATDRGAEGIKIRIRDTGKGIPKNELMRIFDPFFTTKAPGEGTGLGLAITLQIIKNHQGKIEVKSEVGRGTEFLILFPIHEET